ncbi:2-phospho-L-lactate guanylyltransferase [Sphingobium sufflavum]|uniref:2-phospho-L-lactate guanylyltransferase n=1 Tax=Sphingobium sufflavum TaxID=1129547 RepID=UPI001F239475|nr:2-phospho-L-lactate guanylyltransferase [Sphingobium sufflavum]MCE7795454.1 2-phospho-L-lactate guanylyltransferase [Sphingobium sufflavum]
MQWTAIVPFNHGRPCKTRLAPLLSEAERNALALAMARHVVGVLAAVPGITAIRLVAPVDPALAPALWVRDGGRGLNGELAAARAEVAPGATLFLHADLPLLTPADLRTLLDAAEAAGSALAADMAGRGTNAIALADARTFAPAFGADSLATHRQRLPDAALVARDGLSCDVDDAVGLHAATTHGFSWPIAIDRTATHG